MTSPMMDLVFSFKILTLALQRLCSSASPLTSFSAASSFDWQLSASSSTFCFFSWASCNYLCNSATCSVSPLTRALTFSSWVVFSSKSASAASFASDNGFTSLNILLKVMMLRTQEHISPAGVEILATAGMVKASPYWSMIFLTLSSRDCSMFSPLYCSKLVMNYPGLFMNCCPFFQVFSVGSP